MKKSLSSPRVFTAKAAWREVGGKKFYCRSQWEYKYAKYLQFLKEAKQIYEWEYEPKTFWFEKIMRGTRSYLPDFKVIQNDGQHYWVEVKGYMDPKSQTKIKRFKKYFPDEELRVVGKDFFNR